MATNEEINNDFSVLLNIAPDPTGTRHGASREEILELVEIARIKALPLRGVDGGGAAFRAILALADSVADLAMLVEVRNPEASSASHDEPVVERRRNAEGRRHIYDRRRPQK